MAHDVFISYSSKDKAVADAVCATIENRKIRCWIAPRDVPPGLPYAAALVNAINDSKVFVLVFSEGSNSSGAVMREVEEAVDRGIPIIPLRIEDTEPTAAMRYYIKSLHWIDAMSKPLEKHLGKLAESVQAILSVGGEEQPSYPVEETEMEAPTKKRWPLPTWATALLALAAVVIMVGGAWFVGTRSDSANGSSADTASTEDPAANTEVAVTSTIETSATTMNEGSPSTNNFDWHHNPVTDHYYTLTETGMSWDMLEALAVQMGGHLVSINDAAEEEWLYSTFGSTMFWIGLTDYPDEGDFRWTDGEPVTYLKWCPGEPSDIEGGAGTEDAVHAIPWDQCWNDEPTWITEFWDPDNQKFIPTYPGIIEIEVAPSIGWSEWRNLSFNLPNETLWRQSGENSFTIIANPSSDTIAWSDEIITGDFILTTEVSHTSRSGAAMIIVYGDGIGFANGCLIVHYGSDTGGDGWAAFEAHSIYGEGKPLVWNSGDFYFYEATRVITIEIIDRKASLYVDGQKVASTLLPSEINHAGRIGILQHWEQPVGATYSNIRVKTLGDDE
jgi:hypothetical protein